LKVATNVKIAMKCFKNFGGQMPQIPPPLVARLVVGEESSMDSFTSGAHWWKRRSTLSWYF